MNPFAIDKRFFAALIAGDAQALDHILVDDFILIDVMSGSEIAKADFLAFIGSGQIKFESIEPAENRVRPYQTTAIVTGRMFSLTSEENGVWQPCRAHRFHPRRDNQHTSPLTQAASSRLAPDR